ncbi:MAG: hypothetical protein V8S87_08630 [Oscillospiraceae bacterium]|jgi:hypothetical protein|uniref:PTS sugar transporter subunit IIA n=1 Tax=Candidatus Limivicinus sp. TaxID=3030905 RepID=UPI0030758DA6
MTGLIIATHGDLAASALEAAELLVGEQEQVETIGFRPGDSLELLLERFTQAIKRLEECEEILVLTDIKGGSPCNAATVMKAKNPKLRVVAGLSIPLLAQFFESKANGETLADSIDELIEIGKFSIREITL